MATDGLRQEPARAEPGKGDASMSATLTETPLDDVAALAARHYGFAGSARRLSSERDETFLFTRDDSRAFVLKIANAAEDPQALQFQNGALLHLERAATDVPVPRVVTTRDGAPSTVIPSPDGPRILRLLTYLPGALQSATAPGAAQSRSIGRTLAALGLGLEGFDGMPPPRRLMWDISHTLDLEAFLDHTSAERRPQAAAVLDEFRAMQPALAVLSRRQIIHNDFNPHNVLVDAADAETVVGVIDFGDMVRAPLVNDVAVGVSYHVATEDWAERMSAFIAGFQSLRPLLDEEMEVLPGLMRARVAMSIIIAEWRSSLFPENRDYIRRNYMTAWRGLQNIRGLTPALLRHHLASHPET